MRTSRKRRLSRGWKRTFPGPTAPKKASTDVNCSPSLIKIVILEVFEEHI